MTKYPKDVYWALAELVDFYETADEPALLALMYSAHDMAEADDMSVSALGHVKQALLFAKSDLYGRMDVVDGSYGIPQPNRAMSLYGQVDEALAQFPEIKVAA